MQIKDKLLSDLLTDDRGFQKFVSERLTEPGGSRSNFIIVDVNDTYRALITNRGMALTAPLTDKSQLDEFNNTAKSLAVRLNQVPTHLSVKSNDLLNDYKSLITHARSSGSLEAGDVSQATIRAAANDYSSVRTALGAHGKLPTQPSHITQLQSEAAKSSVAIRELTQRQVKSASKREQSRKFEYDNNRGAANNTIIGSLAAVTAGVLMHRAGIGADSTLLEQTGTFMAATGTAIGGIKAVQQLTQSAHLALKSKSPWYSAKVEGWETKAIKGMMDSYNAKSVEQLNRQQLDAVFEVILYSNPTASDKDLSERVSSVMALTGGEFNQAKRHDKSMSSTLSR